MYGTSKVSKTSQAPRPNIKDSHLVVACRKYYRKISVFRSNVKEKELNIIFLFSKKYIFCKHFINHKSFFIVILDQSSLKQKKVLLT